MNDSNDLRVCLETWMLQHRWLFQMIQSQITQDSDRKRFPHVHWGEKLGLPQEIEMLSCPFIWGE